MRNFEEDFDFDFEQGVTSNKPRDFRGGDVYKSVDFGSEEKRLNDPKLQTRIQTHQERVRRELVEPQETK